MISFTSYRVFFCDYAGRLKNLKWILCRLHNSSLCSFFCYSITLFHTLQAFYNTRNLISILNSMKLPFHLLFCDTNGLRQKMRTIIEYCGGLLCFFPSSQRSQFFIHVLLCLRTVVSSMLLHFRELTFQLEKSIQVIMAPHIFRLLPKWSASYTKLWCQCFV